MTFGTHLLASWVTGAALLKNRRERILITLSGVLPDLDALGAVVDRYTGTTNFYLKYHHYLGHSLLAAIFISTLATFFAKAQKGLVFLLAFFVFHLHLLCDIIGSKGPDGYQWPIYYLYPFNKNFAMTWSGQWELNAWQNQAILITLFIACFYILKTKGITFIELFSKKLDRALLQLLTKYSKKR